MASSGGGATFLPEDVVIQILSRLPVKSLLRIKCVCKYWYTLVKTPSFISEHYRHNNNRTQLLVHHRTHTCKSDLTLFTDESLTICQTLDYLRMATDLSVVVGPVNGLFLLRKDGCGPALWNPATREFRTLPEFDPNLPQCFVASRNYFGFGLDPLTNNYKVICICYFWDVKAVFDDTPPVSVVGVYNLATDSWSLLDHDSASMPSNLRSTSSIFMNGAHYWLSLSGHKTTILAFDMGHEVFRVIQVPLDYSWGCLSLYNDTIALISEPVELESVDVWVMESEGCWTKHFSIGSLPEFSSSLGLWKNNELFLENRFSELVLYNLNTRETRYFGIKGYEYGLQVFKYKESLVSVSV